MVCVGATTALSCASPTGGTWSSSATSVAAVDGSGNVVGIAAGTVTISYTLLPTVYTTVVTVNALPAPISGGSLSICVGSSITLLDATAGGTWVSSNPDLAPVDMFTGVVSGLSVGTSVVNYIMPTSCSRSVVVTVNPVPAAITGPGILCADETITLSNTTPGGAWSSSSPGVAYVSSGTGIVTGHAAGVSDISYTLSTGCAVSHHVTVNASPSDAFGSLTLCSGSFVSLSSTPAGGVWSASGAAISIHSVTGVATGVSAGTSTVTYTLGSGCRATNIVTVHAMPGPITGPSSVCEGASATFANTVPGGMWLSDATSVATVSSGVSSTATVTGVSGGVATLSYVTGPSCLSTRSVTVHALPDAGTITGPSVICAAATASMSASAPGGAWSSSNPSVATVGTGGTVSGIVPGIAVISYTLTEVCGTATTTTNITVSIAPAPIAGTTTLCIGDTSLLTNAVSGGTWTSAVPTTADVDYSSGMMTGLGAGTSVVTYSLGGGCSVNTLVTVNPTPSSIVSPGGLCIGSSATLVDSVIGGAWTSGSPSVGVVATVGSTTGVFTGLTVGTSVVTYALASCYATTVMTVYPMPTIAASAVAASCGGAYHLTASGGVSYVWSAASSLSCATCATTDITPDTTEVVTVTGTGVNGCENTASVTVDCNRIYGHITFSSTVPPLTDTKVWLIQYNPSDSSITATDSLVTCNDGGLPYYQFDSKPAGNYFVKAKLLSSVPGTSGYIPTYGNATPNWYDATNIAHGTAADNQDITLIYGTVPSGPGFISGYVYSGAGKGTSGDIPVAGMLIYLKDAITDRVVAYTYTNAGGGYAFGSLGLGSYVVFPEEFDYYTTPAPVITIAPGEFSATDVTFKKGTDSHTIYPFASTGVLSQAGAGSSISLFPNPAKNTVSIQWSTKVTGAASITIADMTGRVVKSVSVVPGGMGTSVVDISDIADGLYIVHIATDGANVTQKLTVADR